MNSTILSSGRGALTLPGRRLALGAALALVAQASVAGWFGPPPPTAAAAYATQAVSRDGALRVSYKTDGGIVPVNRLHSWTLHIERADGTPVTDATVEVDGDMPEHLHGLPTRPRLTRYLGDGDYLVEGVKFQMGGWWVMDFAITSGARKDTVRFNLRLQK